MKFCYLDESGTGSEPYAVIVGIVVDSQRMHLSKSDWVDLLDILSQITGKQIKELHTRDFYRGNGPWRGMTGGIRSKVVFAVLDWLKERKHKVTFSAIDKVKYFAEVKVNPKLMEFESLWCFMSYHQVLVIQKHFQKEKKNKGNTVLIFDREVTEEAKFCKLIFAPPTWTDSYYERQKKQSQLDQIVDVPYYGDSEQVHLLQVADLIAYFIRLFLEIKTGLAKESYTGELTFLEEIMKKVKDISLPTSTRYPSKGRCECAELYFNMAPVEITKV